MPKKVILIILDSLGIGAMPDAICYGDHEPHTLGHTLARCPEVKLSNLAKLGLGYLGDYPNLPLQQAFKNCCYGKMKEASKGKDTTVGHWEIAGIITQKAFPTFPDGFPRELMDKLTKETGVVFLGNEVASGSEIIQRLGPRHQQTGHPILYTSADSVLQIAADERTLPLETLYGLCLKIRKLLQDEPYNISRIIARPFIQEGNHYIRTANRRDYALKPPSDHLLLNLQQQDKEVVGIGKIEDIFAGEGLSKSIHTLNNEDGLNQLIMAYPKLKNGLIFLNLVDFDMLYGHRRDVVGYGQALEAFDLRLPQIMDQLDPETLLIISADHGCDPTAFGSDHTREFVPLLLYGYPLKNGYDLGIRESFSDLGATIAAYLEINYTAQGQSFLDEILN